MEAVMNNIPEILAVLSGVIVVFQAVVIRVAIKELKDVKVKYDLYKKDGFDAEEREDLLKEVFEAIIAVDKALSYLKNNIPFLKKKDAK